MTKVFGDTLQNEKGFYMDLPNFSKSKFSALTIKIK